LFGNSGALPLGSGAIGLDDGRRYDWRIAAVGGMLVTLLVGWFVWPESKAGLMEDSANADDEYAGDEQPRVGPGAATLAEIDRLLLADRLDEADKLLGPLRDTFPKDPELLWRHGRLLDKSKRKESQALAAYGKAIEADASLLEDKEFYAELHEVMRHPKVRDEALDLALHQMGAHGHKFLLELVNAERKPLSYEHRQRALEELVKAPENEARINRKLNVALDLLQASQSLTPCESYRRALERIAANPDYYYFPRVERAPMPTPAADKANEGDAAHCEGLAERKETVLTMLAILEPSGGDTDSDGESDGLEDVVVSEDETPTTAASKKKPAAPKKNNVKTVRGSSDCKKFGAGIFNKKCRK
jgi:tetratricopeptide (TPR) repeat protein